MANLAGCVWCAITPSLQTSDIQDNVADNEMDIQDSHICILMVEISEILLWFSYAVLWIPIAFMLKTAAETKSVFMLGLSTTTAAILTMLFQWTTGSMYLVVIAFVSWLRRELGTTTEVFLELWDRVYGAEIFHLGVLLTMYCAHNLSWTFTISSSPSTTTRRRPQDDHDDDKDDTTEGKQVRFLDESVSRDSSLDRMEKVENEESDYDPSACSSVGSASVGRYALPFPEQQPIRRMIQPSILKTKSLTGIEQ